MRLAWTVLRSLPSWGWALLRSRRDARRRVHGNPLTAEQAASWAELVDAASGTSGNRERIME